ncbi:Protease 2 [Shimwellia blattae]|nr:Protease 2 [Shimwellia blattae]VEC23062.1 Protease 2 [Shimwellia blattae]
MTLHGETRIDNYYWLRDDTRTDPQILSYLEQENQYGRQIMASQNDLRDTLLGEILQRIPQRDASAPWEKNGYRYRHIYESGGEYPVYQRQPVATCTPDAWDILLDGNQRAAGSEFWDMGGMSVSTDNRIMAVAEDYLSRRQYGLRFKDLESGNWYPETLENVSASFVWANDGATLYYIRKHPQTLLPYQVWRHRVGSPGREDTLIYEERDERYYVSLSKSTSRKYVLIYLSSTSTSEILLLDADDQQAEPVSFLPRRHDHEYSIDHYQHWFYIRSNREGKNFALYRSRVAEESAWKTLIAHRQDVMLESFTLFSRWLVLEEREQGLTQLRLIHRQTRAESRIAFDDPAYVTWVATNPEPDTPWLRYGYSSMTAADTLYALNMDTGERVVLKQQEVPGYQACDYRSERLWVRAEDGAQIPVSVVYHRRHFRKGANPLLVYGYGAYGSSIDADFSPSRLSLLDRGFVVAIAHIRGGGELGQQWYEEGKLDHKMNTFTDYLQVCDALLAQGYGDPGYLYGMGGSAGGLLMGAVVNMRPTLFRGIVAQVPFVDVLTTMLDESIPLTTGEYEEWGNPNEPRWYHYIRQYSPYDNLTPQEYPHMLVTTGLHDSQVQYWEPAKWVAKLREIKQGDNLLLLCTDMDTGHGGKSGRFKSWEGVALEYTFLVALTQGTLPGHDD